MVQLDLVRALALTSLVGLSLSVPAQGVLSIPISGLGPDARIVGVAGLGKYVYSLPGSDPAQSKSFLVDNGVTRELDFVATGVSRDGSIYGYRSVGGEEKAVVTDATGSLSKGFPPLPGIPSQRATSALGDYAVLGGYGGGWYNQRLVHLNGTSAGLQGSSSTVGISHEILNSMGYTLETVQGSSYLSYKILDSSGKPTGVVDRPLGVDESGLAYFRRAELQSSGLWKYDPLVKRNLATDVEETYSGPDPYGVFLGTSLFEGEMNGSGALVGKVFFRTGQFSSTFQDGPLIYYSPLYGWHNLTDLYAITNPVGQVFLTDDGQVGWMTQDAANSPLALNLAAAPVPEPTTVTALCLLGLGWAARRRRKN